MSDIALFYVTFPSKAEAERVAETLLAERVAACVNILARCTSIYRWEGRIQGAEEVPALIKTRLMLAARLRERLTMLHSYEVPVIEEWTASASAAVTAWLEAETG
ncbi:divalent-cation tolerance protein CutA [Sphingomonas sp.]|uniref:divalent-cation tolerance protein CutA n=1 Tax=Sphingomonas sp. TaxID=28214 RepID=UPI002ED89602